MASLRVFFIKKAWLVCPLNAAHAPETTVALQKFDSFPIEASVQPVYKSINSNVAREALDLG